MLDNTANQMSNTNSEGNKKNNIERSMSYSKKNCKNICKDFKRRDPNRIGPILDEIQRIWEIDKYNDLRTFQFFDNLNYLMKKSGIVDPWSLEDDKVLNLLKKIR